MKVFFSPASDAKNYFLRFVRIKKFFRNLDINFARAYEIESLFKGLCFDKILVLIFVH